MGAQSDSQDAERNYLECSRGGQKRTAMGGVFGHAAAGCLALVSNLDLRVWTLLIVSGGLTGPAHAAVTRRDMALRMDLD